MSGRVTRLVIESEMPGPPWRAGRPRDMRRLDISLPEGILPLVDDGRDDDRALDEKTIAAHATTLAALGIGGAHGPALELDTVWRLPLLSEAARDALARPSSHQIMAWKRHPRVLLLEIETSAGPVILKGAGTAGPA